MSEQRLYSLAQDTSADPTEDQYLTSPTHAPCTGTEQEYDFYVQNTDNKDTNTQQTERNTTEYTYAQQRELFPIGKAPLNPEMVEFVENDIYNDETQGVRTENNVTSTDN